MFVFTYQLLKSFRLSRKATRIGWRKKRGDGWRAIHHKYRKTVWTRLLFAIHQTGVKHLFQLMLVSLIFVLRITRRLQILTQSESYIQKLANLNIVKTRREVSKTWSCHIFSESHHSVNWKGSGQQVPRKKAHTMLMAFLDTAMLCLKLLGCFYH